MITRPKYIKIANKIEEDILMHKYQKDLPHIDQLATDYATSKVTIVKAIRFLSYQNVVKPIRGHGQKKKLKLPKRIMLMSTSALPNESRTRLY